MYDKNDTIVMLFHSRAAADQFCSDLKDRDFDTDSCQIIGPDDLPQYGRGEHAVMDRPATRSGFMDKLGSFFGVGDSDLSNYDSLADCLEAQGLSRSDADYYESEVRSGSTMLLVKGGDRIEEIRSMTSHGVTSGADADYDTYNSSRRSGLLDTDVDRNLDYDDTTRDRDLGFRDNERLELREEVAEVERHEAKTGEAIIGKRIVEEHETIDVPKRREELVIERTPVEGRPASGDIDVTDNETISVPLMEEDVTIEKRPVVSEEVNIGKREVIEHEREDVTLRKEELDVDRDADIIDEDKRFGRRDRPAA